MKYFMKIFKESIAIVIISSFFGLFTGTILSTNEKILYTIPVLLLILPALSSLVGDISTVLISRLTAHLYIGTIPPKIQKSRRIKEDFIGLLITTFISLIVIIAFGYLIENSSDIVLINPFMIILIIIFVVMILFVMMFILMFIASIFLFKFGKDPNNSLIPFVSSLNDFLVPFILMFCIIIFI
ncbi:MAG: magnesium transporter [Promethearchaeota archaeon]